jgi:hypothetical protein
MAAGKGNTDKEEVRAEHGKKWLALGGLQVCDPLDFQT